MNKSSFCVILLAGGTGKRMGYSVPKQYLPLQGKPIVLYSFEAFLSLPNVEQIIVVCESSYDSIFKQYATKIPITFARPGARRQDSLFNGIQSLDGNPLVCVHDAARPFVQADAIQRTVAAAEEHGAAVLGNRVKSTIKMCNEDQFVHSTLDRTLLWEMQTPQVVRLQLLKEGFKAAVQDLTVTDDVSLVELIGHPVKVVENTFNNMKVTTPDDLLLAEQVLDKLCTAIS